MFLSSDSSSSADQSILMSSNDDRFGSGPGGVASPPPVSRNYGSSLPDPPRENESAQTTRCATGPQFIRTVNGILNIVVIVSNDR